MIITSGLKHGIATPYPLVGLASLGHTAATALGATYDWGTNAPQAVLVVLTVTFAANPPGNGYLKLVAAPSADGTTFGHFNGGLDLGACRAAQWVCPAYAATPYTEVFTCELGGIYPGGIPPRYQKLAVVNESGVGLAGASLALVEIFERAVPA